MNSTFSAESGYSSHVRALTLKYKCVTWNRLPAGQILRLKSTYSEKNSYPISKFGIVILSPLSTSTSFISKYSLLPAVKTEACLYYSARLYWFPAMLGRVNRSCPLDSSAEKVCTSSEQCANTAYTSGAMPECPLPHSCYHVCQRPAVVPELCFLLRHLYQHYSLEIKEYTP